MICSVSIAAIVFGIKDNKTALCVLGIVALIVEIILYVISIRHLKRMETEEREQKERAQEERIRKKQKEKEERERRILASPVRNLDPLQFEEFTALYIKNRGYYQIDLTPVSGDFGADIIAYNPQGKKVCIQCKKYSNPVGVSAVQEILSAKLYYQCEIAMVAVTSAGYTRQAKELAKKTGVLLYTFDDVLHEFVSADKQTVPSIQQDNSATLPRISIASSAEAYTSNTVAYTGKEYNKNEVNTTNIVDAKRTGHENTISIREYAPDPPMCERMIDFKYIDYCAGKYDGLTRKEMKQYKKRLEAEQAFQRVMDQMFRK